MLGQMCVCVCVCEYVCVCVYVFVSVCMHVCVECARVSRGIFRPQNMKSGKTEPTCYVRFSLEPQLFQEPEQTQTLSNAMSLFVLRRT